ncbi:MAG: MBL fold metallo-hydrolase [Rhodospirillales bacterium]|nr:MBL fold metallo-hydrolase [Rhodospirillales bacterium]
MSTLRIWAMKGAIAVSLLVATQAYAQTPELRRTFLGEEVVRTIEHINGVVYHARTNRSGTAFLVTEEGIILADPLSRDFARWLKEEFATRFGVPVRYVVYSHYHWDHGSGGEVFADTAEFVGHANMLAYLEMPPSTTTLADVVGQYEPVAALDANGDGVVEFSETPEDMQRFPGSRQNIFEGFDANRDDVLSGAEIVRGPISFVHPPNIRYTDEIEIRLGGKRVRLTWMGNMNHSNDMSLITFPDDDMMLIVDYVSLRLPNREMDYELGGFPEWMEAVARTEQMAMDYEYVLTAHGPVGTWEDVRAWREYLEDLRDAVAAAIAAGQTLEEMQRTVTMDEYSHWERFDWVDENVLGMYHFLTD